MICRVLQFMCQNNTEMGKLRQARTAITCSLSSLIVGMLFVWPSYTLSLYTAQNTTVLYRPMTNIESSLVGSSPALGGLIGCVAISFFIRKWGCQKGGILSVMPATISWITISLTKSPVIIVVARFLAGMTCGCVIVLTPIFISEVSEDSIRGTLTSLPMTGYALGTVFSYLMGWLLPYAHVILINIAICFIYLAMIMTVRESPIHYLRNNRQEDASKSIAYYRSVSVSSKAVIEEVSRIKQQLTPAVQLLATDESTVEMDVQEVKIPSYKLLFLSPSSRRAFIIVAILNVFQTFMGSNPVQVYANEIFHQSAPNLSPNFCAVMLSVVYLIGSIVSAILTDKFGRKFLLITSSLGTSVCLIAMGVQLQAPIAPSWVSATFMLAYSFIFMCGAGTIPFVLVAEVFTPEVQNLASMIQIILMWIHSFLLLCIFPFMVRYLGMYGSFYVFAASAVGSGVIGYFWVPETKGLTNEQIQVELLQTRKK